MSWTGRRLASALFRAELSLPPSPLGDEDFGSAAVRVLAGHQLGGLLLAHFAEQLPRAERILLEAVAARDRALADEGSALLVELHGALAGIPFLVLKGRPVAEWLYGDAARRPSDDVDLLLRPRDRDRAARRLEGLGFRVTADGTCWRGSGMPVDLHERAWGGTEPLERLFAGSATWSHAGREFRVPSPGAQLDLLASHYAKDLGGTLKHLLDVLKAERVLGRDAGPAGGAIREAARGWLGLEELPRRRVGWRWAPLAAYWRRRGPEAGFGYRWGAAALSYYAAAALEPRRIPAIAAGILWPPEAASRWRGRLERLRP